MNLANRITLARIFLVPLIMFFLLVDLHIPEVQFDLFGTTFQFINIDTAYTEKEDLFFITYNQLIATLIFIIAASTDGLDGYIARKRKMVTTLGKLLDPLADKFLVTAVLISLVEMDKIPAIIAIIIISREFAVTGLRMVALSDNRVIAASKWGKWKTGIQITAIIALLINNFPFNYIGIPFDLIVSWFAAIITIYSGIDYFNKNKDVISFQS